MPDADEKKEEKKWWESLSLKIGVLSAGIGLLGIPVGAIWTLNQALEARLQEGRTAARESRRPFLEQQLKLYMGVVDATSRFATLPPGDERAKAGAEIVKTYWGQLSVVEDLGVERAMINWKDAVERYDELNAQQQETRDARQGLELASLCLAHCVSASIQGGWETVGEHKLFHECNAKPGVESKECREVATYKAEPR